MRKSVIKTIFIIKKTSSDVCFWILNSSFPEEKKGKQPNIETSQTIFNPYSSISALSPITGIFSKKVN